MEDDSKLTPEQQDSPPEKKKQSVGMILLKVVLGAIILFMLAVAFVLGVCFLG